MKKLLAVIGIIGVLGMVLAPLATVSAQQPGPEPQSECSVSSHVQNNYSSTCGDCTGVWNEGADNVRCQPVCCVLTTVHKVGNWFFWIVLMIAFIMLLWGAIQFMTAGGNEEQTGAARRTLIYALIGVAVAYFARVMIRMVIGIIA